MAGAVGAGVAAEGAVSEGAGVVAAGGVVGGDCARAPPAPSDIATAGIRAMVAKRNRRGQCIPMSPWPRRLGQKLRSAMLTRRFGFRLMPDADHQYASKDVSIMNAIGPFAGRRADTDSPHWPIRPGSPYKTA